MKEGDTQTSNMKYITTVRWKLILAIQLVFTIITHQSIDGVTYQNHFDFEERYSNVRECDPFYWHPLHLPEHCAEMFEKLIRSRVAAQQPVTIVRRRLRPNVYSLNNYQNDYTDENLSEDLPNDYLSLPTKSLQYDSFENEGDNKSMSPYDEMLSLLKRDVKKNPTAPVVRMLPPYGPVAMYKQPISKKSRNLIKKIARAYADAGETKDDESSYYAKIDIRYPQTKIVKNDVAKDKNKKLMSTSKATKNKKNIS